MNLTNRVRKFFKLSLCWLAPDLAVRWLAIRAERHGKAFMESTGVLELTDSFAEQFGWRVLHGEFAGLRLLDKSVGSALLPKLIGSYEAELHPCFRRAKALPWDAVVDIGCAEGFYAVGMAKLFVECDRVYAFDLTPTARNLCKRLAQLNNVASKVFVNDFCDAKTLIKLTQRRRCFIISDCEGYEKKLFTSETLDALSNSQLVIELHERESPGVTFELCERFAETHAVTLIQPSPKSIENYAELAFFDDPSKRELAVNEFRSQEQRWLVAIPNAMHQA